MKFQPSLLSIVFLLAVSNLFAQESIPLGTWRSHFSYNSSTSVSISNDKVYSGSASGLFYFDNEFNSLHPQSTLSGFSQVSVAELKYSDQAKVLIIAYNDCSIDLVVDGKIVNLPALKNARVNTAKRINHILLNGSSAYISTSFGLAFLDLARLEIREIYQNIGVNGNTVEIFSSAVHQDSLYVASSEGLRRAKFDAQVNLQDFNNWSSIYNTEFSVVPRKIASYNNTLYVGFDTHGIYSLANGIWTNAGLPVGNRIRSFNVSAGKLLISLDHQLLSVSSENFETIAMPEFSRPFGAEFYKDGSLWIADSTNGLLKYHSGTFESIIPNGPSSSAVQRLASVKGKVLAFPGGLSQGGSAKGDTTGFFIYEKGIWNNYNAQQSNSNYTIPPYKDFLSFAYDQENNVSYVGSFENGILRINPDNSQLTYDQSNSPLKGDNNISEATRISDMEIDFDGSLWALNYNVTLGQPSLHKKGSDDSWQSFIVNHPLASQSLQLEIDYSGNKWLRINPDIDNGGLLVFNDEKNRVVQLNTRRGQGGLTNAEVNDMEFDVVDGSLWLATNNGVSVFYSTFGIFEGNVDATRPIFENQYLLKDSKVTAIEIDEGGRKWIGTESGGVYLFNSDVSELIHHFTEENSALPSNKIIDIAINTVSGEAFFATALGIMSFRSDATESELELSDIKVFPNPVTPGFRGIVGISGLVANTSIKITDVSGRLIYKTVSNGGTASWPIGSRSLRTGVYYVFAVSESGEEKLVSKFAVVE